MNNKKKSYFHGLLLITQKYNTRLKPRDNKKHIDVWKQRRSLCVAFCVSSPQKCQEFRLEFWFSVRWPLNTLLVDCFTLGNVFNLILTSGHQWNRCRVHHFHNHFTRPLSVGFSYTCTIRILYERNLKLVIGVSEGGLSVIDVYCTVLVRNSWTSCNERKTNCFFFFFTFRQSPDFATNSADGQRLPLKIIDL